MNILLRIVYWLLGWPIRERPWGDSEPDTTTTVVSDVVGKPRSDPRWYMTNNEMLNLLRLIRLHEGGPGARGYNADYALDDKWTLTSRSFDDVRALGRSQVTRDGEASSAIGAYQFLSKTLDSLKQSLKLTGTETFDQNLQDDLGIALMARRGLWKYCAGQMTAETFANNLAKEWASLPVVTSIKGARRQLKIGQSYYAGDGLNKAHHDANTVMAAVKSIKTPTLITRAKGLV